MKTANERLKIKFDVLDRKIDFMINHYHALQYENKELNIKIEQLQADKKDLANEAMFPEKKFLIQSRIDRFLRKLNTFSNNVL